MTKLDDQLAAIETMSGSDLKDRWAALTGRPAPRLSTAMLRLAVGYEVQTKALGGLSHKAKRQLDGSDAQAAAMNDIRPGMRLAREHGGIMHVVTIGDGGEIMWNDRQWRSLSEVARAITGTRWSGPAFFGLRSRKAAA